MRLGPVPHTSAWVNVCVSFMERNSYIVNVHEDSLCILIQVCWGCRQYIKPAQMVTALEQTDDLEFPEGQFRPLKRLLALTLTL